MPQSNNTPINPTWTVLGLTEERTIIGTTQTIPVTAGIVLVPPTNANLAEIQVEGEVRVAFGVAASATIGERYCDRDRFEIESLDAINAFSVFATNGNAILTVNYYNHINRN